MKARILNGIYFGGLYSLDFLEKNTDSVINGELVSEWVLTDILPNPLFIKPEFNGDEWIEGQTEEQIQVEKIKRAIAIDLEYTKKISDLMIKHNDKLLESFYNDTVYVIPKSALDAKQALKDECNAKILELGITDFTYRQSVPKLAKII